MIINTKAMSNWVYIVFFTMGYLLPNCALAQVNPVISLFTASGEPLIEHDSDDPLLLYLTVDNPQALITLQQNQRNLELQQRFQNSEAFTQMSAEERQVFMQDIAVNDIPMIKLGDDQTSVVSMVKFLIRDEQGEKITLSFDELASNDTTPHTVVLGDSESLLLYFAITSAQLNQLPIGTYFFTAALDASEQQEPWNGVVYSNIQSVTLVRSGKTPDAERLKQRGLYLLADHQFQSAEDNARTWIDIDPESVDAWLQLGQALHGQNQAAAALQALRSAESKFRNKYGNRPDELPEELEQLIAEVETGMR